jgi:hypothetical protein
LSSRATRSCRLASGIWGTCVVVMCLQVGDSRMLTYSFAATATAATALVPHDMQCCTTGFTPLCRWQGKVEEGGNGLLVVLPHYPVFTTPLLHIFEHILARCLF